MAQNALPLRGWAHLTINSFFRKVGHLENINPNACLKTYVPPAVRPYSNQHRDV